MTPALRKFLSAVFLFVLFFLGIRYLLPLAFPFLLGLALALTAEPMVRFLSTRLRLRRAPAAGIGVATAFSFLAMLVLFLFALLIRELGSLAGILPELEAAVRTGMDTASGYLMDLAEKAPGGIRTVLTQNVESLFSGGSMLLDRVTDFLLRLATGIVSHVPDQALTIGTAIISSFMISAKLPTLKAAARRLLSSEKLHPLVGAVHRLKAALGGWLKAQAKLSCVTFTVTALGFLLLQIPHALLWALLTALVDAFPILGTGTLLVPWSLLSFLQGDHFLAFGLLGVYAAAALTRSVLEPRLLGKHLGLDPLLTLVALYAGYRIFGFVGMLLAPMLAVTAAQLLPSAARSDP